jgi:phage shock protein PspC (stress-responsive transcriptional regulator)
MKSVLRKLSSRKLWAAIAGAAVGIATIFGADTEAVSTVAGSVMTLFSVVAYIMTEGKVDAAHAASKGDERDV